MVQKSDEVLTLKQVADYLKVSEITVHRLTQRGVLPGVKIGRQWRFSKQSITELLRRRRNRMSSGSMFDSRERTEGI